LDTLNQAKILVKEEAIVLDGFRARSGKANAVKALKLLKEKKRPEFKHTEATRLMVVKKGRGGINWYRYQERILKAKLLPFAKDCQIDRPDTRVQKDHTHAYAHHEQIHVYNV
jgi:hypothetical protein